MHALSHENHLEQDRPQLRVYLLVQAYTIVIEVELAVLLNKHTPSLPPATQIR